MSGRSINMSEHFFMYNIKMDVLSDLLKMIRLNGSVYFNACFCSPWGMAVSEDSKASFHIIVNGNAWLKSHSLKSPLELKAGDIVVFPRGSAHTISEQPDSKCLNAAEVVDAYRNNKPLFNGNQDEFNIICGFFKFDRSLSHPFLDNLPEFIHINSESKKSFYWLDNIINQIIEETNSKEPASDLLVDKFTEVLFIQVIRAYAVRNDREMKYISSLLDSKLSKAIALMHETPSKDWTVEELAKHVGLSRSVFYSRFNDGVGIPPMKYLTQWRMMQAKNQLENGSASTITIAEKAGYQSESAFQKAFKRFFNITPASVRKK